MTIHNDLSVEIKSDVLCGKRIALCVTGSIAAVETVKLARELRRYGATVFAMMTETAQKFITPLSLEWATTEKVMTDFTSTAEHIPHADLVLVAPATLHTINKVALGFADSMVTTTLASAWGKGIPIVFVPAMHDSLANNLVFQKNLEILKQDPHLFFLNPKREEGKAKLLDNETIVSFTSHLLHKSSRGEAEGSKGLVAQKILITAGPTRGPIDPVRFISNYSSGELGVRLAHELYLRGADPVLIYGPGETRPHDFYRVIRVKTPAEMQEAALAEVSSCRAAIFAAAVLDHIPDQVFDEKISSSKPLQIQCKQTEKIIRIVDSRCDRKLLKIGFKLEWKKSDEELQKIGFDALETMNVHAVVVNDLSQMGGQRHPGFILHRGHPEQPKPLRKQGEGSLGTIARVETKSDIIRGIIQILEDDL